MLILYYKINKTKKAEMNFEISTLIEPKYYKSYMYLGDIALFDNKDNEKAFLNYTKAIILNSNNADAYYSRSFVYYYMHDFENALKDIEKAISLDSKNQFYIDRKKEILENKAYYYSDVLN